MVSLKKLSIDSEKIDDIDMELTTLSEEEALLETTIVSAQPTNSDLMKFLIKMNDNLAANNVFKATATKRLNDLDVKVNGNTEKIVQLETRIAEMNSSTPNEHIDGWCERWKLRNNINIVGIHPSSGENLTNIVLHIYIFYGLSISSSEIEAAYRVKYSKSNMIIVRFINLEIKLKLLSA